MWMIADFRLTVEQKLEGFAAEKIEAGRKKKQLHCS
jgi:hypothetical protein